MSCVTCTCLLSPVTCHQCQQPQPQNPFLLTLRLFIQGWITKTNNINPPKMSKPPKFGNFLKGGSQFSNFSDTLFDLNSPAFFVLVADEGDNIHIHGHCNLQTELAQGLIQCKLGGKVRGNIDVLGWSCNTNQTGQPCQQQTLSGATPPIGNVFPIWQNCVTFEQILQH